MDQPVESYEVNRQLADNDEIITGKEDLKCSIHDCHTLGHLSLYELEEGILVCGDLFP